MKKSNIKLSRVVALIVMVAIAAFGLWYSYYHLTVTKNIPTALVGLFGNAAIDYIIYISVPDMEKDFKEIKELCKK